MITPETGAAVEPVSTDIDAFDTADTAEMTVVTASGQLSKWVWVFAGPGHERAIAQAERIARERLHEDGQKEAAQVNGRTLKPGEPDVDEARLKNINFILERLITWRGATRAGEPFEFSAESARAILLDPKKSGILLQSLEFLGENKSFTPRSSKA